MPTISKIIGGIKMKETLKQVVIDVLAEKVQELEWELHSKNQIIEDLEQRLSEMLTNNLVDELGLPRC